MYRLLILVLAMVAATPSRSETLSIRCDYEHTNPFATPPSGSPISAIFDLEPDEKNIFIRAGDKGRVQLVTVFWDAKFIGAIGPYNEFLGPSITSYLFDRKLGELVTSHISSYDFDREQRQAHHTIVRSNGSLSNILYRCSRVGSF